MTQLTRSTSLFLLTMVVMSPTMSLTHWHLVATKFYTTTPDYVRVYLQVEYIKIILMLISCTFNTRLVYSLFTLILVN